MRVMSDGSEGGSACVAGGVDGMVVRSMVDSTLSGSVRLNTICDSSRGCVVNVFFERPRGLLGTGWPLVLAWDETLVSAD